VDLRDVACCRERGVAREKIAHLEKNPEGGWKGRGEGGAGGGVLERREDLV
jgi:hypothetical protein